MLTNAQYAIIAEREAQGRKIRFDAMKKELMGHDFPHAVDDQSQGTVHKIAQLQNDIDRLSFMIEKLYELRYHKAPPRHVIT